MSETRSCRYENVFAQASLQFCGHVDEYLIENTRNLCLLYVQPRFGEHCHTLRRYEEGRLVEERMIRSSQKLFLYYWLWFVHHNLELWRFARKQRGIVLAVVGHPVCLFGCSLMRLFRRVRYSYLIGDYFPERRLVIRAYERVKRFYHDRVDFSYYLTDAINRKMNRGTVVDADCRRTVMWGLDQFPDCVVPRKGCRRLLFVGLMRRGQGVEHLLDFVSRHRDYSLSLVGVAANGYDREIRERIVRQGLAERVYFENRFHSEKELRQIARSCLCGLALYDLAADNFTHYADPGKVKAYMELSLPVVMTRISDIVPYVERFQAGEVVDSLEAVASAVERIAADELRYMAGVAAFNAHFSFRNYYAAGYSAWEGVWK